MLGFSVLFVVVGFAAAQLFPVPLLNPQGQGPQGQGSQWPRPSGPFQPSGQGPFRPPQPHTGDQPAPPPTNVDLVIVGVSTGNRNPQIYLTTDPSQGQWGPEGPGQLNNIGKREGLGLGQALRQRYGNLVSQQYYPTNFVSMSSTGQSEQMTAQVVNTGMFPPVGRAIFDPSIQWQPVPVTTDNTILGLTRLGECQTVREALRPILNGQLQEIRSVLNREQDVINYIRQQAGIQGSLEELSEVAENLRQMRRNNMPLPQWAENPTLGGFDREALYNRIQIFRNAVEVACSVYEPCRRIVSGVILNQIVDIMTNIRNVNPTTEAERRNNLGMVVYTGDVEVILSIMRVLNLDYFNVPTTGGFILELRTTSQPSPTVRVLYHQPSSQNPSTSQNTQFYVARTTSGTSYSCPQDFCPLQTLVQQVRPVMIPDYRTACGMPAGCPTQTTTSAADMFVNPKLGRSGQVDCNTAQDQYPQSVCIQLARNNYCNTSSQVRNVRCRRTCNCNQPGTTQNVS